MSAHANDFNVEEACNTLLRACDKGLPLTHLCERADVSDRGRVAVAGRELQMRAGAYLYYQRGFVQEMLDDYSFSGFRLLVGCKGAVSTREGKLLVIEAEGRFSVSDSFHIVKPRDEDRAYLRRVLEAYEAGRLVKGTHAARVIELASLRRAVIPWPDPNLRSLYVRAMSLCDEGGSASLKVHVQNAWMASTRQVDRLLPDAEGSSAALVPSHANMDATPTGEQGCDGMMTLADSLLQVMGAVDDMVDIVAETPDLAHAPASRSGFSCVCFPEPNQGVWVEGAVEESDPRWVFGSPPRNKANYAWIQQTVSCMKEGGIALLLLCNAPLHSCSGRERVLRRSWAASGLIEMVIALPGGLFPDGRPPTCLVVMRKGRVQESPVLFVNAQELGLSRGFFPDGSPRRDLPHSAMDRIVATFAAWRSGADYRDVHGFCASVGKDRIEAAGFVLTPWTYV